MINLTDKQVELIVKSFFTEQYPHIVGATGIGDKLLRNGTCIVAGTDCVFSGGIGNFISTEPAEDAVDCLKYTLDAVSFLASEWFKSWKEYINAFYAARVEELESEIASARALAEW